MSTCRSTCHHHGLSQKSNECNQSEWILVHQIDEPIFKASSIIHNVWMRTTFRFEISPKSKPRRYSFVGHDTLSLSVCIIFDDTITSLICFRWWILWCAMVTVMLICYAWNAPNVASPVVGMQSLAYSIPYRRQPDGHCTVYNNIAVRWRRINHSGILLLMHTWHLLENWRARPRVWKFSRFWCVGQRVDDILSAYAPTTSSLHIRRASLRLKRCIRSDFQPVYG